MNKAKKFFAILMSVFMLTLTYVGCPNVDNGTDDNSTTDGGTTNPGGGGTNPGGNTGKIASLQAQIDSTPAGGTVDLSLAADDTTETIKITKPITVNAAKVAKGLKVEVAHNISSNVGLKGFQSGSSLKIASSSLATVGRGAIENENADTFKNYGDGALPLFLDGCDFTKFESESDVAVYFEGEKSVIDELEIKKGENRKDFEGNAVTEDVKFTFIDMGEKPADMSSIGKMFVDKGIEDVNLIGGKFEEVKFDPEAEMRFKFDGEVDQFAGADFYFGETKKEYDNFEGREFWEGDFWGERDVKDITVAEKQLENGANGVYKYTMSREKFDYLNGAVSIVFLTDAQAAVMDNQVKPSIEPQEINGNTYSGITGLIRGHDQDWGAVILPETPAYTMSLMGDFVADSTEDGVHAVHGSESHYMADAHIGYVRVYKQVYLDHYQTYSKDAVVLEIGDSEVTYYVNTAAVRKSNLLIGAWPHIAADGTVEGGIAGSGSKLSVIDLSDYKPYFVVNHRKLEIAKCIEAYTFAKEYYCTNEDLRNQLQDTMYDTLNNLGCLDASTNIKGSLTFPMDPSIGYFDCGSPDYIVYGMTEASYPTATVEDVSIPVPNDTIGRTYVDVYYWENGSFPATPKNVILGTIDPWLDDWYYFTKENCSDDSYLTVAESMQDATNQWIADLDGFRNKLWAKPKEKVNVFAVKFVSDDMYRIQHSTNDPMGDLTEFYYSNTLNITTEQQYVSLKDLISSFNSTGPDGHNGSNLDLGWKDAKIYKVYDFGKDRLVESQFSEPVAPNELKNLKDGDTIYLVKPYVILNKVSNGSGTSFGSIEVFGFHNGSNETVSLYDMPEFEGVNWYKDASLAADKKWTKAELKARLDAEVFFEQNVIIYDSSADTEGTKMSYDTFVSSIANETYYANPDNKGSKITEVNRVQGIGNDLKVYKYLSELGKDNLMLHVHGLGSWDYDICSVSHILNSIIGQNHYTVYADAAYTQKLETREQFEALDYEADVYARLEGNYAKSFSVVRDNGSDTMSYANLLQAVSNPNSSNKYYTDEGHTTQITTANIDNLADGATIYYLYVEPSISVVGISDNPVTMTTTEINNALYTINDTIIVPFNGKAYNSPGNNPQYLFYSDEAKEQLLNSAAVAALQETLLNGTSVTLYAEKVKAIYVAQYIVSVPDTAIEKYLAAGAHFYSDKITDEYGLTTGYDNPLTTMDAINTAFTNNGKIYLEEDIITEPGSYQPNGNYNYYVVTVYRLDQTDDQGNYGTTSQTMFRKDFDYDISFWNFYTSATSTEPLSSNQFENGADVYVDYKFSFNDYRAWEQGGEMAYSVVKKTSEVVALLANDNCVIQDQNNSRLTTLDAIKTALNGGFAVSIFGLYTYYDLDNLTDGNPTAVKVTKNELESGISGYFFTDEEKANQIESSSEWVAAIVAGTPVYHSNNP